MVTCRMKVDEGTIVVMPFEGNFRESMRCIEVALAKAPQFMGTSRNKTVTIDSSQYTGKNIGFNTRYAEVPFKDGKFLMSQLKGVSESGIELGVDEISSSIIETHNKFRRKWGNKPIVLPKKKRGFFARLRGR